MVASRSSARWMPCPVRARVQASRTARRSSSTGRVCRDGDRPPHVRHGALAARPPAAAGAGGARPAGRRAARAGGRTSPCPICGRRWSPPPVGRGAGWPPRPRPVPPTPSSGSPARGDPSGRGRPSVRAGWCGSTRRAGQVRGDGARRRHPRAGRRARPGRAHPRLDDVVGPRRTGRAGARRRPARGRSRRTGTSCRGTSTTSPSRCRRPGPRTAPATSSSRRPTTTRPPRRDGAAGRWSGSRPAAHLDIANHPAWIADLLG